MSSTLPAYLTFDDLVAQCTAPLGFTQGTLTWADAADEMMGTDVPPVSAQQRLADGVRVAFSQASL
ncbi:hypothetical protein [Vreelandella arcis]|uniref:Uncharacterized protein n=1 Tax=Vreelandella arcis TaxID=416873 RepID=A0A1H0FMA4_9GAMM|nr:hypothetical protein [Halomonas arcis]SDN95796.1 hypothetical protein SAMN04487951_11074 [Halomonas arcis]